MLIPPPPKEEGEGLLAEVDTLPHFTSIRAVASEKSDAVSFSLGPKAAFPAAKSRFDLFVSCTILSAFSRSRHELPSLTSGNNIGTVSKERIARSPYWERCVQNTHVTINCCLLYGESVFHAPHPLAKDQYSVLHFPQARTARNPDLGVVALNLAKIENQPRSRFVLRRFIGFRPVW